MPQYVELHAQSAFSFLEGASSPEQLALACANLEVPAMALTDAHGVYGSARFHYTARKLGIKPIVGAEVELDAQVRLPLLVATQQGYRNLCQLLTGTKLRDGPKGKVEHPVAFWSELEQYASGLVCLTGGDHGPLAHALKQGGITAGRQILDRLVQCFGHDSVYIELQRHGHTEQEKRNEAVIELARAMQLPLLATNGVQYAGSSSRPLQDVFTCLRHKTTLEKAGRLLARNSERHLKTPKQMLALFSDVPEAVANSVTLAGRLAFTLQNLGYEFPHFPTPGGESEMSFLRKRTFEGALGRYGPKHPKAYLQIEHELTLIEKLKHAAYSADVNVRFRRKRIIGAQRR